MNLTDRLKKLAGRMGLVHVVEQGPGAAPAKVATRSVSLAKLLSEVRGHEVRALSELPAELSVPFERVFEAAGIAPGPQAWHIDRLKTLLETAEYRALQRPEVQRRLSELFAREKVVVEELLKDTVARDVAIDAYAGFVKQKIDARVAARTRELAELTRQTRELQERAASLRDESRADRERWREWKAKKIAYEAGMAWAIGYVLDRPVVSVDTPEPERSEP